MRNIGSILRTIIASSLVLVLVSPVFSQGNFEPLEMPKLFNQMSAEVVTPHISWLKPCPGGRLKALFIMPRQINYQCSLREIIELMERLDISITPVITASTGDLWSPTAGSSMWDRAKGTYKDEVLQALRKAVAGRYDLVILARVPASKLPEDVAQRLKLLISNGAGLIWTFPDTKAALYQDLTANREQTGRDFITEGTPFDLLPGLVGGKADENRLAYLVSLYRYGKGRIASLSYHWRGSDCALSPLTLPELDYEYYVSFLIKAILWATRREPRLQFAGFPTLVNWDRDKEAVPPELRFGMSNGGGRLKAQLALTVRSQDDLFSLPRAPLVSFLGDAPYLWPVYVAQKEVSIAGGNSEFRLSLPRLPCGDYFVEVGVTAGRERINWATAGFTVRSGLAISEVVTDPQTIDLTAPAAAEPELKATVRFSQPLPDSTTVALALVDTYSRLLLSRDLKVDKGQEQVTTTLRFARPYSCVVRVRAELKVGGESRSIATGSFTTLHRRWDDFLFGAWMYGDPRDYPSAKLARLVADYGVEAGLGSVKGLTKMVDIRPLPLLPRTFGWGASSKVGEDHIARPCRYQSEEREKFRKSIEPIVKECAPYDPLAYTLPDDDTAHLEGPADECWCDACISGFRKFLKEQYGQVESLNREWGSTYTSFDQVIPITRDEGIRTGRYAPVIDLWRFNYAKHGDFLDFLRRVVQKVDPHARYGSTCMAWYSFWNAFDWKSMMNSFQFLAPYGPTEQPFYVKYARSFHKPGSLLGLTYGGYNSGYSGFGDRPQIIDEEFHKTVAWRMIFDHFNSCWWYAIGPGQGESGLSPWLTPYPCFRLNAEQIREIKSGLGELILGAQLDTNGIAIHYSIPSLIFAELTPNSPPYDQPWTKKALIYLLNGLGFQYDFVPTNQILAGKLRDYRVLILPVSEAVSVQEAEKIRDFVAAGGLVIADVRPGLADGHGKLWACPLMQELFGLKWEEPLKKMEVYQGKLEGEYRGIHFSTPIRKLLIDRSVILNGAQAVCKVEDAPLIAYRSSGKGTAICLNATFLTSELQDILRVVLAAHGIEPSLAEKKKTDSLPNTWLYGLECSRFSDGAAQYVGMTKEEMRGDRDSIPLLITVPTPGHLYEPRTGKYLGYTNRWETSLKPTDVKLWSVLPYRVKGLEIRVSSTKIDRGESMEVEAEVKADGKKPGRHILHFQLIRPDGEPVRYFAPNAETLEGKAKVSFKVALNEPVGVWRIKVSDAATKVVDAIKIEVK